MIGFLKKFWNDITSTEDHPGYWTSVADTPVFVYGGDPLCTFVVQGTKKVEVSETSKNLESITK